MYVFDVDQENFEKVVLEGSNNAPVVVDFWAPWCGPCKTLGPALEAAVNAAGGKVKMVKVDIDRNQNIAAQMRIQSIPAVFAFVNGQPVDGFMGAQSPSEIKAFIEKVVAMGGGNDGLEEALTAADEMLDQGAVTDAAQTYAAVLGEDRENVRAIAGMARAHLALGDIDKAKAILDMAPEAKQRDVAITTVRAQIELTEAAAGAGDTAELQAAVDANPDDHQARFDLALALIGAGDAEGAIDALIEIFRRDREWNEGAAKEQLFKLFDSLGPKSVAAQKGRRRLSSMIFL